ncbi:zinc transporter 2-like isoform X2 [Ctenocephalides felis]|uniref:zinc transporter 2-like isoform X2 n=1 Tax=Ctenocephalides felis TaxID=7515 RepID=UPI000E6E2828|nr:zinc transporter 2-like isoform X2 [Ctenocephalides felis]
MKMHHKKNEESETLILEYSGTSGSLTGSYGAVTSPGSHRVVYCVHGKAQAICCGEIPPEPHCVDKFGEPERHCHFSRKEGINEKARRKLIVASTLCVLFMIAEVVGGCLSGSLAIATDAAHLLTDFASFMISLFSLWVASRPPTRQMSFGWYRAEVIGAVTSVLMIWVVTGILVYMAILRIVYEDFEIDATIMLVTSGLGVGVTLVMGASLHQHDHSHGGGDSHSHDRNDDKENINVRAAFIHVIGDFIQSFGVFIAALVIYYKPSWSIIDPICTFLFSVLVLGTTFSILRDALQVLMEGMPRGVDFLEVMNTFLRIDGVVRVHNLRVWALSLDKTALSAHLAIRPGASPHGILKLATRNVHDKYHFFEMTLQIEEFRDDMEDCNQCNDTPLK